MTKIRSTARAESSATTAADGPAVPAGSAAAKAPGYPGDASGFAPMDDEDDANSKNSIRCHGKAYAIVGNRYSPTTIVAAMTTQERPPIPTHVKTVIHVNMLLQPTPQTGASQNPNTVDIFSPGKHILVTNPRLKSRTSIANWAISLFPLNQTGKIAQARMPCTSQL